MYLVLMIQNFINNMPSWLSRPLTIVKVYLTIFFDQVLSWQQFEYTWQWQLEEYNLLSLFLAPSHLAKLKKVYSIIKGIFWMVVYCNFQQFSSYIVTNRLNWGMKDRIVLTNWPMNPRMDRINILFVIFAMLQIQYDQI